ncbi:hypothetical protein EJB05_37004, partial [Eragrostis curvula]
MGRSYLLVFLVIAALASLAIANFHDEWAAEGEPQNAKYADDANGVSLSLVNSSSGCRLRTKTPFLYGSISSLIKLVPGDSAGTVTAFYASTVGSSHDEIDFEFIGNEAGKPYTFHTNLYATNVGNKEVEFKPWFDPTAGFHNYTISWSSCMVVWYVDGIPIRVFRNEARNDVAYPTSRPMYSYVSIWASTGAWTTHGGQVKTDWSKAPFVANFHNVNLDVRGSGPPAELGGHVAAGHRSHAAPPPTIRRG